MLKVFIDSYRNTTPEVDPENKHPNLYSTAEHAILTSGYSGSTGPYLPSSQFPKQFPF